MVRWTPLIIGLLLLDAHSLWADDGMVKVKLTSGREFRGVVDARTDADQLWLRAQVGEVQLQRPIAWDRITTAELDGEAIELAELKEQAGKLATPGRVAQLRPAALNHGRSTLVTPTVVRSIRCNAWLGNWDGDAEFDGIVVEVEALDQNGTAIAATGTIEAELIAIDYQQAYLASTSGGRVPTSLGNWSQLWDAQGGYVQLELTGRHPQRDGKLSRYALLKVRVTIPGSGVFEQEIDGIRTRPFTPVRDGMTVLR
jgi:hypothetical protein